MSFRYQIGVVLLKREVKDAWIQMHLLSNVVTVLTLSLKICFMMPRVRSIINFCNAALMPFF